MSEEKWTSVNDRLPEANEEVLIAYWHKPNDGESFWLIEVSFLSSNGTWYQLEGIENIEYWMPLPEPPKKVDGDGTK